MGRHEIVRHRVREGWHAACCDALMNEPAAPLLLTRDALVQLLSCDEVTAVALVSRGAKLAVGEQYLELDHLEHGVRNMRPTTPIVMASVLARRAVRETTWAAICARLVPPVTR